ncbi:MAG: DegT/DnrJ/EryC1/StrS family aminotransferase [Deltaproteobacteria bacterium]|nr:DegT/DnrJ/EryC1/StrS family aminotransferase [Deltaproteobacteria bacterium]
MRVPLLDLRRDTSLDAQLEAAFRRVLQSGHYILGPEAEAFERACADYVGARFALGVSSGTDALLLALMAAGVGPGDEVICPTFTFFATAGTIARLGAKPVFVDIRPCCFNADAAAIEEKLSARTKAVVPVHLFGQCAEMQPIRRLCQERGVFVLEDAAQAFGATTEEGRAGALGHAAAFSFFPSKNLGAFGDAGLVTTDDAALAERMSLLRTHGAKPKYFHAAVGGNFRIDALQSALLAVKLPHLDGWTDRRQKNASLYRDLFSAYGWAATPPRCWEAAPRPDAPILLPPHCRGRHIYNQFVIRVPGEGRRDALRAHLAERGVGTEVYYPVAMHQQACFASLSPDDRQFPEATLACRETVALPIFPELTEAEIDRVVSAIKEFVER